MDRTYAQSAHDGSAPDYREPGDDPCPFCGAQPGAEHLPTLDELAPVSLRIIRAPYGPKSLVTPGTPGRRGATLFPAVR